MDGRLLCPYNPVLLHFEQLNNTIDEDDNVVQQATYMVEGRTFTPCLQGRCAAWQEGRCTFNTTST